MTYRSMGAAPLRGLGATPITDQALAYLTKGVIAQGGCGPALQKILDQTPCLSDTHIQWFGKCLLGPTPAGVSDLEWAAACLSMHKCGAFDKLGCAADAPPASSIPACFTPEQLKEMGGALDYCRTTPKFDGPSRLFNAACWSVSRYPAMYQQLLNTPACAVAAPPHITEPTPRLPPAAPPPAPPAAPPPVVVAPPQGPPPPDYTAPVTPDQTPTTVPTAPGPDMTATTYDDMTAPPPVAHAGMSESTKYALWGVGALVAIGVGWMVFRKK